MGLGLVLVFWAVAGTVLASVGAVILGTGAAWLTRSVTTGRRKLIVATLLFPFACLAWAGGVFVFQGVVNEVLLHRDLGLGDTWHCPLPNGYQILFIDITDQGWVYNPKTQPSGSSVMEREDAVGGVRNLQVVDRYILLAADSKAFEHAGSDTYSNQVDSYFLLDTQTGKRTQFENYDALRGKASQLNIGLDLQPIYSVYSHYRFSWFDVLSGLLFCVGPIAGLFLLIRWTLRLRRSRPSLLRTI